MNHHHRAHPVVLREAVEQLLFVGLQLILAYNSILTLPLKVNVSL